MIPATHWTPLIIEVAGLSDTLLAKQLATPAITEIIVKIQADARQDALLTIEKCVVEQFK